jgi:hypothetical protein
MNRGLNPYAQATPFQGPLAQPSLMSPSDPAPDVNQAGTAEAAAAPAAAAAPGVDFAKLAAGLSGLASSMKPPEAKETPMPAGQINRPQVGQLPQFASNNLLLELARRRAGAQRSPAGPMPGLLGG